MFVSEKSYPQKYTEIYNSGNKPIKTYNINIILIYYHELI